LNPSFVKVQRKDTRFIVIHSTECGLESALRTLSKGKELQSHRWTRGGHAHYLVARTGTIYRILDPRYRADHAGLSLWKGVEGLSDHALGVELEGFHDSPFTSSQYRSLRWLLRVLRKRFRIASRDVLEHYRVAYTPPNRFFPKKWRGRKRDPGFGNFERRKAGLLEAYAADPDVLAGRVGAGSLRAGEHRSVGRRPRGLPRQPSNVITSQRSAWSIAGRRYRDATTLYHLPNGTVRRGSEIANWGKLPPGTRIRFKGAASPKTRAPAPRTR